MSDRVEDWHDDERIEDDPDMNEKSWATQRIERLEREIAKKQATIDFYVDLLHDYNVENEELTKAIAIIEELAKERYCKMQTKIEILQDSCDAWARIVERQYKEIDVLRAENERRHNGRANW